MCVHCGKFNCKFLVAKVARMGISGMFRSIVPTKTETAETHQIHKVSCFRCKKIQLQVFCCESGKNEHLGHVFHNCCIRNRKCHYAPSMSVRTNKVDWVHLLRKIQLQVFSCTSGKNEHLGHGLHNCCIRNHKCQNAPCMSFRSNMIDWVCLL